MLWLRARDRKETLANRHILGQPFRTADQSCPRPPAWTPPRKRGGAFKLIGGGWRMRGTTSHVFKWLHLSGLNMAEMETQNTGTEDGFTPVTYRGGRRAKKRQAEQSSAAGQDGDAGRMDTEEARPAKRPVFPPLSGDQLLVGIRMGRGGAQASGRRVCSRFSSFQPASLHSPPECVFVFIADWERRNEKNSRPS